MGLIDVVKNLFGKPQRPVPAPPPPADEPDAEEIRVPECQVSDVLAQLHSDERLLLLDVREPYEWRQVRIPAALHIPMNDVPRRLDELPLDRRIVVFCAHGSRSFGVTYYLCQQGFDACNLVGGITWWHVQGGDVEVRTVN